MILISLALALIAIVFGAKLLAQSQKENLGAMYKYLAWFVIAMGFLIILGDGAKVIMRCCRMHNQGMMRREMMMNGGGGMMGHRMMGGCQMRNCDGGNMSCGDDPCCRMMMNQCNGNTCCTGMNGGNCCSGGMMNSGNCSDGKMNCPDGGMNSSCNKGGMPANCPMMSKTNTDTKDTTVSTGSTAKPAKEHRKKSQ